MNEKMIATAVNKYAANRLEVMVEKYMPDGKYIDLHNDHVEECDMIVMLLNGDIIPLKFGVHQCMNPLRIHKGNVYLSTFSLGARHFECAKDLDNYIEEYNTIQLEIDPKYIIIGYHIF